MWSQVMEELIQDSPPLRELYDRALKEGLAKGEAQGHLLEARALLRELAEERFPDLSAADLAAIDQIESLDRVHAIRRALNTMTDLQMLRQALAETPTQG